MNGAGAIISELVDGYVLPNQLDSLFMMRQVNNVPMLAGSNADEGTPYPPFATTLAGYNAAAQAQFGSFAPAFMKAYPVANDADVLAMAYEPMRDGSLGWQAFSMARAHAALGQSKTFVYFFNRRPNYFPNQHFAEQDPPSKYGAYHSLEQPYFYNNLDRSAPPRPYTQTDRMVSAVASAYLVNFATRGDPNGHGLPNWPAFVNNSSQLMYLGDVIRPGPLPNAAGIGFYDSFYGSKRRLPF
jgi:para-nitrobenzyl esterase